MPRSFQKKWSLKKTAVFFIAAAVSAGIFFWILDALFPVNLDYETQSCTVVSRDKIPLRAFADENGIWRYPIRVKNVSKNYIEALIGFEDRYFYSHPGVNPFSLLRALFQLLKNGRIVSGGSTLTMQVARMKRPGKRTIPGKCIQIFTAFQLERHFTKNQILNYYMNHAPFGGVYQGVQAASFAYFEHGAQTLTHAQAALLAVMPQAPTRFRPDRHPETAQAARDKLLDRMLKTGIWSKNIVVQAKKENITGWPANAVTVAPLLARRLYQAGKNRPSIETYIDYPLQLSLEQLARDYVSDLPPRVSVAILVMDNNTGGVTAYVGSADFANDLRFAHVDMITAMRSPGSTMKPFIYGMALDQGLIHSQSLLMDIPIQFKDYQPVNFNRKFSGPVSASHALSHSLNLPAVQLLDHLGPMFFYTRMINAGFEIKLPADARPNLSLALGGFSTSLENLVMVYSSLGRGGKAIRPRYETCSRQIENHLISEGAAWIIQDILQPAAKGQMLDNGNPFAVKTGTSYGYRDAWAIGVDKTFTAGVWIGRPDGVPIQGFYGASAAEPLLKMVFRMLPHHDGTILRPQSVTKSLISWPGGQKLNHYKNNVQKENCPVETIRQAWLLDRTAPRTLTRRHDIQGPTVVNLAICRTADQKYRVPVGCRSDFPCVKTHVELWPRGLESFLPGEMRRTGLIPPEHPDCLAAGDIPLAEAVEIKGLSDKNAVIRKSPSDPYPVFKLTVEGGNGPWYWFENSKLQLAGKNYCFAPQHPGVYQILVMDQSGTLDRIDVQVL